MAVTVSILGSNALPQLHRKQFLQARCVARMPTNAPKPWGEIEDEKPVEGEKKSACLKRHTTRNSSTYSTFDQLIQRFMEIQVSF